MSHQPRRVEYDLGPDRFKRRSRLIAEVGSGGVVTWQIVSDAMSQQDEGEKISSLTSEQLIQAGNIAVQFPKRAGA